MQTRGLIFCTVDVKSFVSDVEVSCLPPTIFNCGRVVDEFMRRMDAQLLQDSEPRMQL